MSEDTETQVETQVEPQATPAPASKSTFASKTQWINALSILLPLLGVHFGVLTPEVLTAMAALLDCAVEDLPKAYATLLALANMVLRQVTTSPVHITKPK